MLSLMVSGFLPRTIRKDRQSLANEQENVKLFKKNKFQNVDFLTKSASVYQNKSYLCR